MYFVYLAAVFDVVPQATFLTGQIATAIIGVFNCVLVCLGPQLERGFSGQVRILASRALALLCAR